MNYLIHKSSKYIGEEEPSPVKQQAQMHSARITSDRSEIDHFNAPRIAELQ